MKTFKRILKTRNHSKLLIPVLLLSAMISSLQAKSQTTTGIEMGRGQLLAYDNPGNPYNFFYEIPPPLANETNRFDNAILDYINEMRADPKAFYKKYVEEYIREKKSRRFTYNYTHSLRKDMLHAEPLPLFQRNSTLRKTATFQLDYLAQYKGTRLTHEQGNIGFEQRMERAGLHCLAENLYAADDPKALDVVLDLLIDQGVPSFGHRKNLMNPMYTHIGIVSETPRGGRMIVVMDFGCGH
ncbi:MAG: CAP domain-containing protein [Chitinophagaceae bacterium]